eukprot:GHVS01085666.1.p1 GENE.GHVS01085666.1~~GHVS01085666.1.p1  ORF type:complete len:486 (-),score=51.22 GHVS01085666.1:244-1701(-)
MSRLQHRGVVLRVSVLVLVWYYAVVGLGNEFIGARVHGGTAGFQPCPLIAGCFSGPAEKRNTSFPSGRLNNLLGFVRGVAVPHRWRPPSRSSAVGWRSRIEVGHKVEGLVAGTEGTGGVVGRLDLVSRRALLRGVGVGRIPARGFAVDEKGTVTAEGGERGDGDIQAVNGPIDEATVRSLEVDPYYDILGNIPMNTIKHKQPLLAHVNRVESLVTSGGRPAICHVELDLEGKMRYWEGQSIGVVPPGNNPKTGKPNSVRLYSIASTRYGDDGDGRTVSLCVRRAVHIDPLTGKEDEEREGLCSKLLCTSLPGTPVNVVGPSGKVMILPEATPNADLIMVATGTGIAPYRGFWRRLFVEDTPAARAFGGLAWLLLGVPDRRSALYQNEWTEVQAAYPDKFRVTCAFSREMTTPAGDKMYVQDRIAEHGEEIFTRIENGAHVYFCGLKKMMPGITETFLNISESRGSSWESTLSRWKANKQWHVEVY